MAKNIQTIRREHPTICLSVFDHFVGLTLKGLKNATKATHWIDLLTHCQLRWFMKSDNFLWKSFQKISQTIPLTNMAPSFEQTFTFTKATIEKLKKGVKSSW